MAIEGKKINELTQISDVSNETVLPAVYVNGSTTASTANKISMQQISNKVQDDMSTILANKQDKLTAGENITIVNNVISATGSVDENKIIVKSSTIPTASGELLGKIYCYSGETNATYTHGYIYECVGTTDNAAWQRIDVQPGGTSEQAITTIDSTSGSISLETNKVYKVTLNGNTTFVLPNTVDNTKFNQIYLQINLTNNSNINFGTSNYFAVQPALEIGENRITYEYDANEQAWYVGKIGGEDADTSLSNITNDGKIKAAHLAMPSDVYEDLTIPSVDGTDITVPADGYLVFRGVAQGQSPVLGMSNNTNGLIITSNATFDSALDFGITMPCKKGDSIKVGFYHVIFNDATNPGYLRFVYANGSKNEHQGA